MQQQYTGEYYERQQHDQSPILVGVREPYMHIWYETHMEEAFLERERENASDSLWKSTVYSIGTVPLGRFLVCL